MVNDLLLVKTKQERRIEMKTRIKFFVHDNATQVEKQVNDWLEDHDDINIISHQLSTYRLSVIVTIIYATK
jgi:CHAD domain-containing protein